MTRNAPPSPDHREWTAAQVEAHAEKALAAALDYFRIPDHWETVLFYSGAGEGVSGQVAMDHRYLRACITLDTEELRRSPRIIWEVIGHEVAHIADAPYDLLWRGLPEKVQEKRSEDYVRAMENAVTQRTRMFLRDVPDPAFMEGT